MTWARRSRRQRTEWPRVPARSPAAKRVNRPAAAARPAEPAATPAIQRPPKVDRRKARHFAINSATVYGRVFLEAYARDRERNAESLCIVPGAPLLNSIEYAHVLAATDSGLEPPPAVHDRIWQIAAAVREITVAGWQRPGVRTTVVHRRGAPPRAAQQGGDVTLGVTRGMRT